jgi:hypothetical protein
MTAQSPTTRKMEPGHSNLSARIRSILWKTPSDVCRKSQSLKNTFFGAYLMPVERGTEGLHTLSMREKIRAQGPSILSQSKIADCSQNAAYGNDLCIDMMNLIKM